MLPSVVIYKISLSLTSNRSIRWLPRCVILTTLDSVPLSSANSISTYLSSTVGLRCTIKRTTLLCTLARRVAGSSTQSHSSGMITLYEKLLSSSTTTSVAPPSTTYSWSTFKRASSAPCFTISTTSRSPCLSTTSALRSYIVSFSATVNKSRLFDGLPSTSATDIQSQPSAITTS